MDLTAKVAPRDILHLLLDSRIWLGKFQMKHNHIGATTGKKQAMRMLDKQNPGLGVCAPQQPNAPSQRHYRLAGEQWQTRKL